MFKKCLHAAKGAVCLHTSTCSHYFNVFMLVVGWWEKAPIVSEKRASDARTEVHSVVCCLYIVVRCV